MEKSLEQLRQEYEKTTVLLEREKRKMQRLKNRHAPAQRYKKHNYISKITS